MIENEEKILLGHITGVSGLKGWVKVHSDTDPRENIVKYSYWWLEQSGRWKKVQVIDGRPQGKTIVASLEGVNSPEQASMYIGAKIAVGRTELPVLKKGEFYWADLVGMQVRTVQEENIGVVLRLFETGANDVMVVKDQRVRTAVGVEELSKQSAKKSSASEVLVPWLVPDVITDVNVEEKVITIDWDPDF